MDIFILIASFLWFIIIMCIINKERKANSQNLKKRISNLERLRKIITSIFVGIIVFITIIMIIKYGISGFCLRNDKSMGVWNTICNA